MYALGLLTASHYHATSYKLHTQLYKVNMQATLLSLVSAGEKL